MARLIMTTGVDACNTVLEVLLFAAATNLGQSWKTVLTLFGGKARSYWDAAFAESWPQHL